MAIPILPMWHFEPNWDDTVSETLEWMTSILTAQNGAEQRQARRAFPRRTHEFTVAVQAEQRAILDMLLVRSGAGVFFLPTWFDVSFTTWPAEAGSGFISCTEASTSEIRDNGYALLMSPDPLVREVIEVSFIGPAGINLKSPLNRAWPMGTRVYPLTQARLTDQPEFRQYSSDLYTAPVRFTEIGELPAPANNNRPATPHLDSFVGLPVLTTPPDRQERLTSSYERMLTTVDNGVGNPHVLDTAGRSFPLQQYTWTFNGRTEHRQFRQTLDSLRGRAKSAWLPTWADDLYLAADVNENTQEITVRGTVQQHGIAPLPGREVIMIEMPAYRLYRRINAMSPSGGNTVMLLDNPISGGFAKDRPLRISYMDRMRLNHDAVEIVHHTDTHGLGSCRATFRADPASRT